MEQNKLKIEIPDTKNFVRLGRSIFTRLVNNVITPNEFLLLVILWLQANPRNGAIPTSYSALSDVVRNKLSVNVINKTMLSLRRKRLIYFPIHKGVRGTFEVKIAGYPLSTGNFLNIDVRFDEEHNDELLATSYTEGRGIEDNRSFKQNSQLTKDLIVTSRDSTYFSPCSRGANNDNEKENKFIDVKNSFKGKQPVETFIPNSYEETFCLELAKKLGEADMTFLLSNISRGYFWAIQKAEGVFRDLDKSKLSNPPAYFNSLLQSLIRERENVAK